MPTATAGRDGSRGYAILRSPATEPLASSSISKRSFRGTTRGFRSARARYRKFSHEAPVASDGLGWTAVARGDGAVRRGGRKLCHGLGFGRAGEPGRRGTSRGQG